MSTPSPVAESTSGHFDNDEVNLRVTRNDDPQPHNPPWMSRTVALCVSIVVLGVIIGVCAGLLTLLLYQIEHIALGFVESPQMPGPFATHPWRRAISLIVGASVAAVLWWWLRTRSEGIPSVKGAVEGKLMPWWQTVIHVLLQIFIVGCGLSVGREVAPRELGAMLAQRVARRLGLHDADLRTVIAIAAGAGLAGVYNAPLAGAFFAIEILLVNVSALTVALALACSTIAAWVATLVKGTHAFYLIGNVNALFTPDLIGFAVIIGILAGIAGAYFRRGAKWAESHKAQGNAILWQLPCAGVLTAVVAIWIPQVMGNGRATAQMGFAGRPELMFIPLLLLSFVAKAVITLLTIRAGASGGVLTPAIALGSSLGCAVGILWITWFGTNSIGVYALLGACALLSASQHAPLMAMTLVMSLTEAPSNLFVPVVLASAIAVVMDLLMNPQHDGNRFAFPSFEQSTV